MRKNSSWSKRAGKSRFGCRRSCAGIQLASHIATFYNIIVFTVLIQPSWLGLEDDIPGVQLVPNDLAPYSLKPIFILFFWAVFVVTVGLYSYVCFADTRYQEDMRALNGNKDFEGRKCEECSPIVTHFRVKHCQTCGGCIEGFDHHCRYLNVCIGRRTYRAWFAFVCGLYFLMLSCSAGACLALFDIEGYNIGSSQSVAFIILVSLQLLLSAAMSLFLTGLLGQHFYFISSGMTTLEYVKDQTPGFPRLPPYGWREAVVRGLCFECGEGMIAVDVEDPDDIWYCSICQSDIARAGVEFYVCETCDDVHVCPVCRSLARAPSVMATTFRSSTLRRRAEAVLGTSAFRDTASTPSRQNSLGRQPSTGGHQGRRGRSSFMAAIEGHTGDIARKGCCNTCCGSEDTEAERQGYKKKPPRDDSDDSDGSTGTTSTDDDSA